MNSSENINQATPDGEPPSINAMALRQWSTEDLKKRWNHLEKQMLSLQDFYRRKSFDGQKPFRPTPNDSLLAKMLKDVLTELAGRAV